MENKMTLTEEAEIVSSLIGDLAAILTENEFLKEDIKILEDSAPVHINKKELKLKEHFLSLIDEINASSAFNNGRYIEINESFSSFSDQINKSSKDLQIVMASLLKYASEI